ncbi:unnamed protein product [Dibothriocephalus latus]|uniref:Annexin n=1 Tax=Dibothriocephalus latus TaxID=60516 RepID=A0A3P7LSD9_DIBLA|nr:unnamed protein product [Dibothriocephalus latus]
MSNKGTVIPPSKIDPHEDAAALEKAMKGVEIAATYKSIYGKDLKDRLDSELKGHFKRAVLYSFYDMAHVNARACYKAVKGAGTDEQVLIDVICTSTNEEIEALKKAYSDTHRKNLESDVKHDTAGNFEKVLVALLQGKRGKDVDDAQLREDCEALYKGGEAVSGTDETTFTRILVTRSWNDIVKLNELYKAKYGHDLLTAIGNETSLFYKVALQTIVRTALDKYKTYAEILYRSMKGLGTHDDSLIRLIMAHSEVDLAVIRHTFDTTNDISLYQMIQGDTTGDYRNYLLAILEQEEVETY